MFRDPIISGQSAKVKKYSVHPHGTLVGINFNLNKI